MPALRARRRDVCTLLLTVCVLGVLPGCFTYVPADAGTVPPGEEVRVTLSRRAMAELPEEVAGSGTVLLGQYVGTTAGEVRIRVPVGPRGPNPGPDLRQEARVPSGDVEGLEIRRLHTGRTVLLTVGSAAAAAGLVLAIMQASGNADLPGDPPPEQFRLPLFRIPLR